MVPPSADAGSPVTFPMSGQFSDEDIHELLGAMGDHTTQDHLATLQHHAHHEEQVLSAQPPGAPEASTSDPTGNTEEEEEEQDEEAISAEARAQARSERKRSREKQRRSDVNKQFADLTQLLRRIEAEDLDAEGMAGLSTFPSGGPTNRVDLIARTIAVLERMHKMSCKRRHEVVDLNRQLEDMKKMAEDTAARLKEATLYQQGPPKPIMMMVPMMVNPNTGAATSAVGATAPGGFAMAAASPFMQHAQPQMFMPQMAAGAATTSASTMMPQVAQHQMTTTAQVPQQQTTAQVPHVQQPLQMPQQLMAFPQLMLGGGTTTPSPPPPAPSVAAAGSSSPQQQQGQKQPSNINGGGGNLAHCA